MPNPWDLGSAMKLANMGFQAVATTSSGFAMSLGREDYQVSFDELLEHAAVLANGVDVPVSVDAEHLFAEDAAGVARNVRRLVETGVAGCSIEDWSPQTGIDPLDRATERVAAAVDAGREHGFVITARAEGILREKAPFDEIVSRLCAYRDAGADCLFAPRANSPEEIARLVREVGAPINVLVGPKTPSIPELRSLGVRRVSTGGALARAAYGEFETAARALLD